MDEVCVLTFVEHKSSFKVEVEAKSFNLKLKLHVESVS